jgi:hypothetical protein
MGIVCDSCGGDRQLRDGYVTFNAIKTPIVDIVTQTKHRQAS